MIDQKCDLWLSNSVIYDWAIVWFMIEQKCKLRFEQSDLWWAKHDLWLNKSVIYDQAKVKRDYRM